MTIKIWEERDKKGISLRQLSSLTGISKTRLNNIENGKKSVTLDELERIAIALEINMTNLFDSKYK